MKKIKLLLLLLLPIILMSQETLIIEDTISSDSINRSGFTAVQNIYDSSYQPPSVRDGQFFIAAPSIYLMDLYMQSLKNRTEHIGWEVIIHEQKYSESTSVQTAKSLYFPEHVQYLDPIDYNHNYYGSILYGFHHGHDLNEFNDYLRQLHDIPEFIRAEKIIVPKKASFQDFYEWAVEYFESQLEDKN